MKSLFNIAWRVLALLALTIALVVNGCNSGSDGPTAPSVPDQHENMKEEAAYSEDFWASAEEGAFKINIPQAGDYKAIYTTNMGTFETLFRLSSKALVTVELKPGNVVTEVLLQRGTIVPVVSQALEMFDEAKFVRDESFNELLLISGGAILQSRPTPTPTPTPAPVPTANPLPSIVPQPSPNAKNIVAIGDSITYGSGSRVGGGYPTYLEVKFLQKGYDVNVINEGIPGDWAWEVNNRFEYAVRGADAVLLMAGTNDVVNGDCKHGRCSFIANIEAMIDKAVSMGIPIFISTIIAANTTDIYDHINDEIWYANQQIEALGAARGVLVVDNYEAIKDSGGDVLYDDRLHLTDAGYEIMANIWYRNIRDRF